LTVAFVPAAAGSLGGGSDLARVFLQRLYDHPIERLVAGPAAPDGHLLASAFIESVAPLSPTRLTC